MIYQDNLISCFANYSDIDQVFGYNTCQGEDTGTDTEGAQDIIEGNAVYVKVTILEIEEIEENSRQCSLNYI